MYVCTVLVLYEVLLGMASPPNVEMEAAKFLHKLIQESKDEPTKLATKLHVVRSILLRVYDRDMFVFVSGCVLILFIACWIFQRFCNT